jgi:lysophospholipid acyltransferase
MPWIGFAFVMAHMSINHIHRQAADSPSTVDITGAQMVLLMKLSAFCWNVADGQLPEDQLSDFQKDRMLKDLPPLLDYTGYVLFFPALFGGPAFDYQEYRRWIDTTMFDVAPTVDPAKKPPVRRKRKIPRSGGPAAWKAAMGLFWIALFMGLSGHYNTGVLVGDTYMDYNILRRIWIMYVVNFVARLKYYGVWSLTEGACILTGLGFNGVDPVTGKISWNRLQNIDPWGVETAQNPRAYLAGWNINTNNWLRNYVYLRVTPRGKKPGFRASLMTFGTSALWHGFYPGYYLTFVLASLIQTSAKRRHPIRWIKASQLTQLRLPKTSPSFLPGPYHRPRLAQEEILRHRHFYRHPAYFFVCHHSLPRPQLQWLVPRLVPSLSVRCCLDSRIPHLLRLSRQGDA